MGVMVKVTILKVVTEVSRSNFGPPLIKSCDHSTCQFFLKFVSNSTTDHRQWPCGTRMGPNNASDIVWALGMFFFLILHVFNILTNSFCYIQALTMFKGTEGVRQRVRLGGDGKNGPNETSGVVWAITSKVFLSFFFFFVLTSFLYILFRSVNRLKGWGGKVGRQ